MESSLSSHFMSAFLRITTYKPSAWLTVRHTYSCSILVLVQNQYVHYFVGSLMQTLFSLRPEAFKIFHPTLDKFVN